MIENNSQPQSSWVSIWGQFDILHDEVMFKGYPITPDGPKTDVQAGPGADPESTPPPPPPPREIGGVGRIVSNRRLTDGTVSVDIEFDDIDENTTAEILLFQNPVTDEMMSVGLGANSLLVNIRHYTRAATTDRITQQAGVVNDSTPHWKMIRAVGNRNMLQPGRQYHLEVRVKGSLLTVELDGVDVGSSNLPLQLANNQVGFFCQSKSNIHFRHFRVDSVRPLAFVVMQFSPPEYEELFNDVISPVCDGMGLEAFRASQTYAPGLVIGDIQRQIRESRVVIAEITPMNANVYYEVGYADAIGKPVILIADGGKLEQLPFDVRAFRTIFYENTIGGKTKVEKTLTEFLKGLTSQKA